ncbi:hypothetical protein [Flavisolibacter tropicus]|uniref:Uncharacterized protein n=1 Tax=Flavisolibacter tropicus TaxID=1492898 RepID=A0A172TWX2_9BACT|nr:hypothetical protein [Flavisolibacter tropicus]ANE51589.1 hypothetical protein SY85_14845 [Flavisolibacter tropicus]
MKKWIIAAACILTFSGYAAAQNAPAKALSTSSYAAKAPKKNAEAAAPVKKDTKKTAPEPIKITIPRFNDNDTLTSVPKSGGRK